jgi:hypothetical protein
MICSFLFQVAGLSVPRRAPRNDAKVIAPVYFLALSDLPPVWYPPRRRTVLVRKKAVTSCQGRRVLSKGGFRARRA